MLIKNGQVLLFEEGGFKKKDILVENGKIVKVADFIDPETLEGETEGEAEAGNQDRSSGCRIIDAAGKYITPGLIDAHSHICISEEGMGAIGDDCNDYSDAVMPYLETIDAINPFDLAVKTAVAAGVTAACVCPGSDSVVGGVCSVVSLNGAVADEMALRRKAAIKCSFGENPKRAGYSFKTRMGNAYLLRKCIEDAIDYKHRKEEAVSKGDYFRTDIGMEHMLLALERKIPLHAHVHRADDVCTAIRIAREYDLDLVIIHCTDGISIVDYLSKFDYPVILGPTMYPRSKLESMGRCFETAGILNKAGIKICITADHDVTPIYYLSVYAAQSVRAGLDEIEGFKAITKNPAEVLGIHDRKGELKAGRDADIVLWSKHPFAYDTKVEKVFLEGREMTD